LTHDELAQEQRKLLDLLNTGHFDEELYSCNKVAGSMAYTICRQRLETGTSALETKLARKAAKEKKKQIKAQVCPLLMIFKFLIFCFV